MEIHLTPEQSTFVHQGIEEGRFQRPEDAVGDALALWVERERARIHLLAEIEAGDNSPEDEDVILDSDESIAAWIEGVKQRGRARLAAG